MKFKGSGRFQNVTLLGDDHILNTFYLGTSSSRSDDVEWFTGNVSFEVKHIICDTRALRQTGLSKHISDMKAKHSIFSNE